MGRINEPRDIDFYFENRDLTEEECKKISEYIRKQREKRSKSIGLSSKIKNREMVVKSS